MFDFLAERHSPAQLFADGEAHIAHRSNVARASFRCSYMEPEAIRDAQSKAMELAKIGVGVGGEWLPTTKVRDALDMWLAEEQIKGRLETSTLELMRRYTSKAQMHWAILSGVFDMAVRRRSRTTYSMAFWTKGRVVPG